MSSRSSAIFPTSCTFWADMEWMREVRGPFWLSAAALKRSHLPSPRLDGASSSCRLCEHAAALPVGMSLAARFSSEPLAGGLRDPSNTLEMCQALLP
jgi:hypothetical protein